LISRAKHSGNLQGLAMLFQAIGDRKRAMWRERVLPVMPQA
jgi:hypothetical protein